MQVYEKIFAEYGCVVAQILSLRPISTTASATKCINTFNMLFELNVIPIVNENDTVAVGNQFRITIPFGLVASLVKADLFIILSDIDGLYSRSPYRQGSRTHFPGTGDNPEIEELASEAGGALGIGGMSTKITAAKVPLVPGYHSNLNGRISMIRKYCRRRSGHPVFTQTRIEKALQA